MTVWLPFPRAECVRRGRCPDCGCHVEKQGHKPECPENREESK